MIVVVGSLNADLVVTMRRFPVPGETVKGTNFNTFPGGKGANQAYGAARLGGKVSMVGQTGSDPQGAELTKNLLAAGVDVSHLKKDENASTGVALISIDDTGQNEIVIVPGANGTFTVERLERAGFNSARIVLLQLEIPLETVLQAAQWAKEHGAVVMLDPAPAQKEFPDALLALVDFLTPNESELIALTAGSQAANEEEYQIRAHQLLSRGAKNVLVKMGARGVLLVNAHGEQLWPALSVTPVDTTAAGDCFNAALAVAVAEDKSLNEAIPFANTAAAISVTRHGAQPSMPTRIEVEELMKKSSKEIKTLQEFMPNL